MKTTRTRLSLVITTLFAGTSLAQPVVPEEEKTDKDVEQVIVTGTRIVNGAAAPTPVTSLNADDLKVGAPTTLADALNKMPQFNSSATQVANDGTGVHNTAKNFINLRGLGPQRALVLFDGNRMPDSALLGGVDINLIPSFLLERVEVVTGGASAVYGSDAVAGVVNFIVDRDFNGLKAEVEAGNAERGDNETYRLGLGAGTEVLNGRGHVLASYNFYKSQGIKSKTERDAGAQTPIFIGAGTAENPFTPVLNSRFNFGSDAGMVTPFFPSPAAGQQFDESGSLIPFNHGATTGSAVIESGGDGFFYDTGFLAELETHQVYLRTDYDINDNLVMHVQGSYVDSYNLNPFLRHTFTPSSVLGPLGGLGLQMYSNNPYLSDSAANTLASGGETFFLSRMGTRFSMNEFETKNFFINAGLKGFIKDEYEWKLDFSKAKTTLLGSNLHNINFAKQSAALDAVTDSGGNIVCRVTLTNPERFPGCVPLNLFGKGSETDEAMDFITDKTTYDLTSEMQNYTFSLAGPVTDLPAGPLSFATSIEYRKTSLETVSNAQPLTKADCSGLTLNCAEGITPEYRYARIGNSAGEQSVAEAAVEFDIPLLEDKTLIDSLSLNTAWRYTDYDTSGPVRTWKVGADWRMNDQFKLRATKSRDIRAPNLNELFAPANQATTGFSDLHTNTNGTTQRKTGGNNELTPEKADTTTVGIIYTPEWLENTTLTVDYYKIDIDDAIVEVSAEQAQIVCEASEGSDPLCDLIVRPGPFSDRSPDNYPTSIISGPVNVATFSQSGVDTDLSYKNELGQGFLSLRLVATYIHSQESQTLDSQPVIDEAGSLFAPRLKAMFVINYQLGDWQLNTQTRWRDSLSYSGDPRLVFDVEDISSASFTDASLAYNFAYGGADLTLSLSMQNIFDKEAPLVYQTSGIPGFTYPAVSGDDILGRRFNLGLRARF